MKLASLALVTFAAVISAQSGCDTGTCYDIESPPFRLILSSADPTLDEVSLGACHEGAATESLCPTGLHLNDTATSYDTFYHNVTSYDNDTTNGIDVDGVLNWHLEITSGAVYPSAMHFSRELTSNLAIPIMFPGGVFDFISFDQDGYAYMTTSEDDMVSPPVYGKIEVASWYVCLTRWSYLYHTLAWKVGRTGEPQNPSCVEVQVRRVFI